MTRYLALALLCACSVQSDDLTGTWTSMNGNTLIVGPVCSWNGVMCTLSHDPFNTVHIDTEGVHPACAYCSRQGARLTCDFYGAAMTAASCDFVLSSGPGTDAGGDGAPGDATPLNTSPSRTLTVQ